MKKNRLNLDFSLSTQQQRTQFITKYLSQPPFNTYPPDSDECTTISQYILWGTDANGKNGHQSGQFGLSTKSGTWDPPKEESLDQLIENPAFNQASLLSLSQIHTKRQRKKFDRQTQLANSGSTAPILKELFSEIDRLDFQIEQYQLNNGKRTVPMREQLLNNLTQQDKNQLAASCAKWTYRTYLAKRHQLVDMRRQQYTIKDGYSATITEENSLKPIVPFTPADFDAGIDVRPLGIKYDTKLSEMVFRGFRKFKPTQFSQEDLRQINQLYWEKKKEEKKQRGLMFIDFRNAYHVQRIIQGLDLLAREAAIGQIQSNTKFLVDTFWYYVEQCEFQDALADLLMLKIQHKKNQQIAEVINKKYSHSYTTNYISTLYCQKIINKIAETAARHQELISNLWFPENWKTCTKCGATLLRDTVNFMRKKRSGDGYNARCKECEKLIRLKGN